jgi:DNA-binding transcriptional ArsR family regulator
VIRRRSAQAQTTNLDQATQMVKGLAHPVRLRLLAMLARGPLCVCQMTAVLGLAASTVSGHLLELRRCGLVHDRREGRLVYYRRSDRAPGVTLVADLLASLAADPHLREDARLVGRLRRVPIEELCAARLDLTVIGLRRAGPRVAS